ncbi:MAG: SpoIIE family protein phosphatase [Candidatus Delongbacteria bacterium]
MFLLELIRRVWRRLERGLALPLPWLLGLSLAWLVGALLLGPGLPSPGLQNLIFLPAQLGLGMAAWRLLRGPELDTGRGALLALPLLLALRVGLTLNLMRPALLWEGLVALLSFGVAGLALSRLVEELWEHRPWQRHRRERLGMYAALLLGLLGLLADVPLLVMPLLFRPVLRWLRRDNLRPALRWYTLALLVLLLWAWSQQFAHFLQHQDSDGVNIRLGGGALGSGRLLDALGPLHTLSLAWFSLQLPASFMVLVGRLIRQSRIRTKLAMNALFSSVLPLVLLTLLFGTLAVVVMGSYRARLVRAQFDERLESGRLVTAWFAQAFEDPLDREAQRRFEQQLRSMGEESHIGRGFFCLYWSMDTPGGSIMLGDSSNTEHWRRLVATWRMPSDFPLEDLRLPPDWRTGRTTGLIRAGDHLWQVALIEQNNLLSAGFFPLDQETLEQIGQTLGTGLRLVSVQGDDNLVRFGLSQIGLGSGGAASVLDQTPDYPGEDHSWADRLFQVGMARLTHAGFPLNTPDEELLVLVESLPGRILPAVFSDDRTVVFPYLILLLLQFLTLLPLLLTGIWIAWMLNWRITRSIGELKEGTDALSRGDLGVRLPEHTDDELGRLATSFNEMSLRIRENIQHLAAKERLDRELSIARTIQQGLLPSAPPKHARLDIASTCRMAQEVGGDYYDFRQTCHGELALALGDVSGKGVAAALVMSNLQASWRSLLDQGLEPGGLNARLNEQLAENTADDMYVTFVQGLFQPDQDRLRFRYSNAGHNPPLLLRGGKIRHLDSGGLALGMFSGADYQTEDLDLKPGDWLVFYTDGLTEALSIHEEEFGQSRLEQTLLAGRHGCARETLEHLLEEVGRFEHGAPRADDQTLLVLRVRQPGEEDAPAPDSVDGFGPAGPTA